MVVKTPTHIPVVEKPSPMNAVIYNPVPIPTIAHLEPTILNTSPIIGGMICMSTMVFRDGAMVPYTWMAYKY